MKAFKLSSALVCLSVCLTVCLLLSQCAVSTAMGMKGSDDKNKILFPKREYLRKHSVPFFKRVNLAFPPISKVEFFVRTETYQSAYIHLSTFISKNQYLKEILPLFKEKNQKLIDTFDQKHKQELTIENHPGVIKSMGLESTPQLFQLLLIHSICDEYLTNRLSAQSAAKYWVIIFKMTRKYYKQNKKDSAKAAVLALSSHFAFFKSANKWAKKSRKIVRKLTPEELSKPGVALILKTR